MGNTSWGCKESGLQRLRDQAESTVRHRGQKGIESRGTISLEGKGRLAAISENGKMVT